LLIFGSDARDEQQAFKTSDQGFNSPPDRKRKAAVDEPNDSKRQKQS
jgi:hypothetical protein